jgi:hypothetical protein
MDNTNGQVMRQAFEEIMACGNASVIDEFFADDFAGHDTAGGTFGREEFREGVLAMLAAFSDRQVEIADQVVAGEKVVTRWRATGVHALCRRRNSWLQVWDELSEEVSHGTHRYRDRRRWTGRSGNELLPHTTRP